MTLNMQNEISKAAAILRRGGIVAFPTETVYGLGAVVFDELAVARIFEAKQRPHFDPLIVHIADTDQLSRLVAKLPAKAGALIERFWPGPLTLILPKSASVPDLVTAGLPSVAVRMPDHPLALDLIRRTGFPLAAPSANPFGQTSPTRAAHVRSSLGDRVDYILDGGPAAVGIESTILSLVEDPPEILRPGGLELEQIEALTGSLRRTRALKPDAVRAPGMLSHHYATRTPIHVQAELKPPSAKEIRAGALAFRRVDDGSRFTAVEILSATGNLREAAANLFGAMHRLDRLSLDVIIAERVPDHGLGLAINDRLTRAAAPRPQQREVNEQNSA